MGREAGEFMNEEQAASLLIFAAVFKSIGPKAVDHIYIEV